MSATGRKFGSDINLQQRLERLFAVCQYARNVLIIIYANPDPDALASALALRKLIETNKRIVNIGFTGAIGRPENASMIRHLKIPAFPVSEEEAARADIIAIVDSQPHFFTDFRLPRCDIVIDHHPLLDVIAARFVDIRPQYMSASSIMTEYLKAAGLRLTKNLASALFYGIKTDIRTFMGDVSNADVEAIRWLRSKADRDIVKRIEFSQFSWEAIDYFSIALVRRRFLKGVMFSHLGPVPFFDVCVQVADFFIRVEKVAWALVTGVVGNALVIVFRNDGLKKDAGYLARAAFGRIGSAGGHKSMGRAEIRQDALPKGLLLSDNRGIEEFVLKSLAKIDQVFIPVLKSVSR
jgi:nanoRNase/pAp phosphatase (c-di-AMP/oligoRNAs hydrolase)